MLELKLGNLALVQFKTTLFCVQSSCPGSLSFWECDHQSLTQLTVSSCRAALSQNGMFGTKTLISSCLPERLSVWTACVSAGWALCCVALTRGCAWHCAATCFQQNNSFVFWSDDR